MSAAWRRSPLGSLLLLGVVGCSDAEPAVSPGASGDTDEWLRVPSDFPPLPEPEDNPLTRERVRLGKRLFFDTQLSRTSDVSCGSCHLQEAAFADPRVVSVGVEGLTGTRNAPALVNLAWGRSFFWDGGVPSLELQAIGPIQNELEMDMTLSAVAERLGEDAMLVTEFERAYDEGPSERTIPRALASFVRTLVSGESPFDRFQRGDENALDPAAERGRALFFGERAECFHCHTGFNFAIDEFRNNGIAADDPDPGRAAITDSVLDVGRFKVPTLRNVAVTAPYMHDGSLETLADVIEHYDAGGRGHPNTDALIHPLGLTDAEKLDLEAFLQSLTDPDFLADPRFLPEP